MIPETTRPTVLITGASRGLGLAFAAEYAARDWQVIATCRRPDEARDLQQLAGRYATLRILPLDVTADTAVKSLAAALAGEPVDVLLNNAGVYGTLATQALGAFDFEDAKRVFDINALGGLRVSEALLANVAASTQKKIVSLGGGLGAQSIGSTFGGHYFMKMSKAAHLMAMGVLQAEVKAQGVIVVMISPGRVDTQLMRDSGYAGPALTAEDSARQVIARIDDLTPAMHGRLVMCDGQVVPW
ncbi:MAG: SDR family oxidoreductase [Gammaproteobacteria bacterium]